MHPEVQRWVYNRRWTALRDAQAEAIRPLLSHRDTIIAAPTAGGKTEAAYLPICTAVADCETRGIRVLNVSPLKALINDQYDRLCDLCAGLEIPVHRWHGDVPSSRKQGLMRNPDGVLLITPESLEALFVTRGSQLAGALSALEYVVVDELHVFIGSERGKQVQSLMHRLELTLRRRLCRVGLSATLGDMGLAAAYLRPSAPEDVVLIVSGAGTQEVQLIVKGYTCPTEAPESDGEEDALATPSQRAIAAYLWERLRGGHHLIFANSRSAVELYSDQLRVMCEKRRFPNEFLPHHGNLAREVREDTEARLKDTERPASAVCTSTLELGVDIGSVDSIAQIGVAPSVASVRQRLGRSGRREGKPCVMRQFIEEEALNAETPPQAAIRPHLFQAVAMIRLLVDDWCEPPDPAALHLSTLVQQVLSLIAQFGAVQPQEAWKALCAHGPFNAVSQAMFADLLSSSAKAELISQIHDSTLVLAATGERIVNHYTFYSAFETPREFRIVAGERTLGTVPIDFPLVVDMYIIFAGRRWRVVDVDEERLVVEVSPAPAGRAPQFHSGRGLIHDRVREEMGRLYLDDGMPGFLDGGAQDLLAEGRSEFRRLSLDKRAVAAWNGDLALFPWRGDRVMNTLQVALVARGLEVAPSGPALVVSGVSRSDLGSALEALIAQGPPDPVSLASHARNKMTEKYHWCLSEQLLCADYASSRLDISGAWSCLPDLLSRMR